MLYRLSKFIPIHFRSTYGVEDAGVASTEAATWWQWRGRVWGHHRTRVGFSG